MDQAITGYLERVWTAEVEPTLCDYITIPNVSPAYAADWAETGQMERAVNLFAEWARTRPVEGLTVEIHRLEGRTPLLLLEIPASAGAEGGTPPEGTVLFYGHLDKQPAMHGWRDDLGPWKPVREGDLLYGRGGADDGYAMFASLTAIEAATEAGLPHARCVVLIEASEESASPDLVAHVDALADRIGSPDLVICLDSGAQDYNRLWVTTSLRGVVSGRLEVAIGTEGVHSGEATGLMADSFRLMRQLLDRLEDSTTGRVLLPSAHVEIPQDRLAELTGTAAALLEPPAAAMPFVAGARPVTDDPLEQLLNRTWRPTLAVTGADGLPPTATAGNVLRPSTALMLSVRIPPRADEAAVLAELRDAVLTDPPDGAEVTLTRTDTAPGWSAPPFASWLWDSLDASSRADWGAPARAFGEGGTIPFMDLLAQRFPAAQFAVVGVLGPGSNAHGPNEFLHLPTARRLSAAMARLLGAHARRLR